MSLTVISAPEEITLARNTTVYKLKALNGSGNLFRAVGIRAVLDFAAPTARFTNGQTITLTYTEPDGTSETVVFTAANTPASNSVTQIPTNLTSGYTNTTYWAEVARVIGSHPRISPFFTATVAGNTVVIEEKTAEPGWDVVGSTTAAYSVTVLDPVAESTPDNYKVVLEVYGEAVFMSGNFARLATLENTPDHDGLLTFDLSSILAAHTRDTRAEPLVPVWTNAAPVVADNVRRYYVRYREQSGTPLVYGDWTYGNTNFALDGGVSNAIWAEGNYMVGLDATHALLTWMPNGRMLAPNEKHYVAWYNHTGDTEQVALKIQTFDLDSGDADTAFFVFDGGSVTNVRKHEVCLLPVWPAALGITDPLKYKYTVQVVNEEATPVSEVRTYYVNRDFSRTERYVQYLNGFGVPEMWRMTGEHTKSIAVSRATSQRALVPGYSQYATDTVQHLTDYTPTLVYRTGYISRAEAEVLQELFLATAIYDVSEAGYIPLRVTDGSADVTGTLRDLHSYQITAQPRLSMGVFSKRQVENAANNVWTEVNEEYWLDTITQPWTLP